MLTQDDGVRLIEARTSEQMYTCPPRIDHEIADVVEREVADPWLRDAIAYHFGWLDEHFRPLAPHQAERAGGKKLRGALAVLAHQAAATADPSGRNAAGEIGSSHGDTASDPAIDRVAPFAAAIELVHNWSLVHDDILDGDRTRRGRPALWVICGRGQAINIGDCMHALAFCCLARLREHDVPDTLVVGLMADLARTAAGITIGQMRDLALEQAASADRARYLEMVEDKSAGLMRCATFGGALLGAGSELAALPLGELGRRLGIAFQMRDDILGIWGTYEETGKPSGTDIRRRKKTLPVVLAFELASAADGERLRELYRPQDTPMTPAEEGCVRDILDRCGAHQRARVLAHEHRLGTLAALSAAASPTAISPTADRPGPSATTTGTTPPVATDPNRSSPPPRRQQHLAALRALTDLVTDHTY